MSLLLSHPLLWSTLLLLADVLIWHVSPVQQRVIRVGIRLSLFLAFSTLIINTGISPLQAVRQKNSHSALIARPAQIKKGGFLSWLQKR